MRTTEHCRLCKTEEQNFHLYLDQLEKILLRFFKSERILAQYERPVSTAKKKKKRKEEITNGKRNSSLVYS